MTSKERDFFATLVTPSTEIHPPKLPCVLLRLALVLLLVAAFFSLTLPILAATPGDLDSTFGNGGVVTTTIGSDSVSGRAVAIQSDGKIVVVGGTELSTYLTLIRYTSDGSLDSSFSGDGIVTTTVAAFITGEAVVTQTDGKIIIAGESSPDGSHYDITLARYNSNGTLDNNFGNSGIVTTTLGSLATAHAVAIQSDGKIVVAGSSLDNGQVNFALARYTITGTLDSGFGHGGIITTSIGTAANGEAVLLQTDNKIVVAGGSYSDDLFTVSKFAIARYTITGSLDSDFGNSGVVTTPIGFSAFGNDAILQPDGKIVVTGYSDKDGSVVLDFALARYNSNGSLDNSFSNDGVITTIIEAGASGEAIIIQPDGKLVVAGTSDDVSLNGRITLARYNSNGGLDNSFGGDGIVTTTVDIDASGWAAALQADKKIIVAGDSYNGSETGLALARYLGDDPSRYIYLPILLKN